MDKEDDLSNNKYPSTLVLLIIIIGLFLVSLCLSIFSLKNNQKIKIILISIEYLELFTSGICFSFSILNIFLENIESNNKDNNFNYNNQNEYLFLFLCLGYITDYFCVNILIQIQLNYNDKIKRKFTSSFFKNNNKNDLYSINSGFNNSESIISNESFEDINEIENNNEKRFSTEEKYFSIFNEKNESFGKKEPGYSCDFSKRQEIKNNIFMFEKLITKNNENKIHEQIYNEKNIQSVCYIILFNLHKLCQGLYIGINPFKNKYFINFCFAIYYFVIIDSLYLGITLIKFQISKNEMYFYIFTVSVLYFIGGIMGFIFKLFFYEILQRIIIYFIIGTFLYSSFNVLEDYFFNIDKDEIKLKESKVKYYFYFFIFGLIIHIFIFYLFK